VIRPRVRRAGDRHVGVADRLDLLHPDAVSHLVEAREHVVEHHHQLVRGDPRRVLREPDQVREQHRDVLQAVGDLRFLRRRVGRLQPVDDRPWQRVAEQIVRPPTCAIQLPLPQEHQTFVPLQAVAGGHPDDRDRHEERIGQPEFANRVVHDPVTHDVVVGDDHDTHDR
jgi:hypothetical protein